MYVSIDPNHYPGSTWTNKNKRKLHIHVPSPSNTTLKSRVGLEDPAAAMIVSLFFSFLLHFRYSSYTRNNRDTDIGQMYRAMGMWEKVRSCFGGLLYLEK